MTTMREYAHELKTTGYVDVTGKTVAEANAIVEGLGLDGGEVRMLAEGLRVYVYKA